ncbi:hypothetical protein A3A46_02565 [Candidatus Roizmanbacteria bacterium RIFCSPLOWO2_01_FULL_37_13]|uniref:Glycosyltransferase RgtA/B/C/D-like domain-containing protein n=1 Tax=Candidatus Roizmanbacteria bacterium RIFCSPHIGHO2_02_FULL_38_11 TaxID=1802039 RepID=A0A1F7H470_9BACT|nr:MAG: hypothetical protein A3C25_04130 [Candidatus Roizmanbacteria bacterium RIFCSPHIGHO2_02_FULL_38_11]OGK33439.1 MAG: hypothetical protein A3F58_02110 [Candidatus Roizmanbacteria bacterium RIFCSPHIGHO2_12_FULL_37_9b]OGK41456.1 MAG: hypothetical protein A3A46_02565 [Candidatus Roizmanbacteria bacterium RIFCSPLOWO2_01_FULL_37_13]
MLLFIYTLISLVLIWLISNIKIKFSFKIIVIFAFILRVSVTLLFLSSKSDDINTFLRDGQYLLDRNPRYDASYFPFIGYLGVAAIYLKNFIHPYVFLKIIFSIFDSAVLFPLYYLAKKNLQSVLIYALNPISIIVINIHGQMESIPLFFFLLSLLLFMKNKVLSSILTLSFAIYTKPWPILFVIPLIKKSKKKLLFVILAFFPLILTLIHSLLFPTPVLDILYKVKNHRGIFGAWGLSKIALYLTDYQLSPFAEQLMRRIFLSAFVIFSIFRKDKNLLKNIFMIMLFLFVFTPTFGIQWFTWLVPFIIIIRPKLWRMFLALGSVYMAFGFAWDVYQNFPDIISLRNSVITELGFFVWIFIIILFFQNVFFKTTES